MDPMEIAFKYLIAAEQKNDPRLADKAKTIHDTYADFPDFDFNERCRKAGARVITPLDRIYEAENNKNITITINVHWDELVLEMIQTTDRF